MPDAALPTVLITDDDADSRLGLRHMLEQLEEFSITEVADGQSALDAMVDTKFDLLLLDLNLPVVSGDVVLRLIGSEEGFKRPRHIVVMSAGENLANIKTRQEAVLVNSYLEKPFRYEDLQDIVADVTGIGGLDDLLD